MANFPPTPEFIKSLDPNSPINENQVLAGDDWFRFVQQVLENQFPTSEDDSANGWDIALTVKASEVNTLQGVSVTDPLITLPAGTAMLFYQNSAPEGWSIVSAVDEHSVRLTQGTGVEGDPGSVTGGTRGGSNDFTDQFAAHGENDTLGVKNKILGTSHIPAHTHGSTGAHGHPIKMETQAGTNGTGADSMTVDAAIWGGSGTTTFNTALITGTGEHEHASVGDGNGHAHTLDMFVKWAACIIATKD